MATAVDGFEDVLGGAATEVVVGEVEFEVFDDHEPRMSALLRMAMSRFSAFHSYCQRPSKEEVAGGVVLEAGPSCREGRPGGCVGRTCRPRWRWMVIGFDGGTPGVVELEGGAEVMALALGGSAVDGDFRFLVGFPGDVGDAGMVDGADLGRVALSLGVGDFAQLLAGLESPPYLDVSRLPIWSKVYSNCWPATGSPSLPVPPGADELAEVVVFVLPVRAVGRFDAGALVGVVVAVGEALVEVAAFFEAAGLDLFEPVEGVEFADGFGDGLAAGEEAGVGQGTGDFVEGVAGFAVALADGLEPAALVEAVVLVEPLSVGKVSGEVFAPPGGVEGLFEAHAVQGPANGALTSEGAVAVERIGMGGVAVHEYGCSGRAGCNGSRWRRFCHRNRRCVRVLLRGCAGSG